MGCCDTTAIEPEEVRRCVQCGTRGRAVSELTVKAILTELALARFAQGQHRFCAEPDCPVVYFTESGHVFVKSEIRVAVWQKEPCGQRTVCYCFGENESAIREEIARDGASSAVRRLREHIKAGRCACEVRNPSGVCCLGDVAELVKRVALNA